MARWLNEQQGPLTEALATDGDFGAVRLVNNAIEFLQVVRVGDELVARNEILEGVSVLCGSHPSPPIADAQGHGCRLTL